MQEQQRRLPGQTTQQVDSPEPRTPEFGTEVFLSPPTGLIPVPEAEDEDFSVPLTFE